jgi:PEP-CTERM/exosortase A-associated glycosyltransferase
VTVPAVALRILHVLDHSLPLHSGYVFRTLAILRQQRELGWQTFHVTTPRQGPATAEVENVDGWEFHRSALAASGVDRLPVARPLREIACTARRLDALVQRLRPDVIHAHSPVLNALPALRVGRRHGIPVVYEVRALWEDAAVDHGTTSENSLRYRLTRAVESYALRRADAVTTICEGLRDDIRGRGVAPAKVTLIPNAVDTERFALGSAPDEALRDELGLRDCVVLGFVGSFYAYEGLDLLLGALARLQRPDVRVLLVGGGPHEAALREAAASLNLGERVVFTGRVPNAAVQRYYDLIDVLVYPRRSMRLTNLVTPLKPLEAMAQGRVLVASDVGGHRELVRDGDNGYLFPAGDVDALAATVERVLARRAEWEALRGRARRFVEAERTWRSSVAGYVDVYQRLVRERSAGAAC